MFKEIVGNETAKSTLRRLVAEERVPQSLVFAGRSGIGKKLFALDIARSFVCTDPSTHGPCGRCSACTRVGTFEFPKQDKRDDHGKVIFSGHPDVGLVIPYRNTILIDAVRDLEREANFRPFESRARVFIIDDAEKLSSVKDNAANALLKTLEEPSETTFIILITARPLLLLSTIRSRCQTVRFGPVSKKIIASHLTEKLNFPSEDAALLAGISRGSLGRALGTDLEKYREQRKKMLAVVRHSLHRDGIAALLRISEEIADTKARDSYEDTLGLLQTLVHDIWTLRLRPDAAIVNFDLSTDLRELSDAAATERLTSWLREIEKVRENLNFNVNKKLATDSLFVTMAA